MGSTGTRSPPQILPPLKHKKWPGRTEAILQGRRRRSGRTASAGPLFWTSMLSAVSLFSRFGAFSLCLPLIFNLLMQSSITLVARVIHRPT